jgi:hypothetical protein
MGARTIPSAADLKPAAVDLHHRQCRPRRHGGCQLCLLELFHLLVALRLQLMANFMGHARQLSTADRHFGEFFQRRGGVLE